MKRLITCTFSFILFNQMALAEESLQYATGLIVPEDAEYGDTFMSFLDEGNPLPDKVDLREEGLVSSVKNQGSCGSCWAFAGAAVLESHTLAQGQSLNLSEQELVSCDRNSSGCSGGWQPFSYMIKNGSGAEADFPYQGRNLSCRKITPVARAKKWGSLGATNRRPSVTEIKRYLAETKRPLWVSVYTNSSWNNPGEYKKTCYSASPNHAVALVGYETAKDGTTYYIIKNSWGPTWNGDGFVKLKAGCDNIASIASFVEAEDSTCAMPQMDLPKTIDLAQESSWMMNFSDSSDVTYTFEFNGKPLGQGLASLSQVAKSSGDLKVTATTSCGRFERKSKVIVP